MKFGLNIVEIRKLILTCAAMIWSITLIISQPSGVNSAPIFKVAKTIGPAVLKGAATGGGLLAFEKIYKKLTARSFESRIFKILSLIFIEKFTNNYKIQSRTFK
ncbi:hypothetical protein PPACK8108_LOCUS22443 [Phakopsora pachyrhizi]|uniref:Uncharacterized protein n=1 Tax=Phakopsora pachyrhizi TaxID=170000 RepID=A0AAV0BLM9_PHAPC|nr:hypothetical protein PPACK8108_LOCUS22443 [Phakopsora pachyrhizi]